MLHSPSLNHVRFAFSFTVVRAIVSITPQFCSLFKFGLEDSKFTFLVDVLGVIGLRFGCHWFTFSVRVLGVIGSHFRFVFWVSLVHVFGSRLSAIGSLFGFTLIGTSHVVLPHFPLPSLSLWFHSLHFLHPLVLVDFILIYLHSLVLLSLSTREVRLLYL